MKINFSRGAGGGFVLLCGNSRGVGGGVGGHQFLINMENPGRWWGGGEVLSDIPSVVGYGYFLEPHIA